MRYDKVNDKAEVEGKGKGKAEAEVKSEAEGEQGLRTCIQPVRRYYVQVDVYSIV